jgi:Peptidase propeptide and YPEB domain.
MKVNKWIVGAVVGISLLAAGVGASIVYSQSSTPSAPSTVVQQEAGPDDQVQEPSYTGSIRVDQAQYEGLSEADEAAALQGMATISADQAKAAAVAANPGTTVVKVELDNENGVLVYSVELNNGLDVKVDAGNGAILHIEQAGADQETSGDRDNVQEEHESQADDAMETPGVEDAVGQ